MRNRFQAIATVLVCFGSGWRLFTYLKHTDPLIWFSNLAWALGTLSVFAGAVGSVMLLTLLPFMDRKRL